MFFTLKNTGNDDNKDGNNNQNGNNNDNNNQQQQQNQPNKMEEELTKEQLAKKRADHFKAIQDEKKRQEEAELAKLKIENPDYYNQIMSPPKQQKQQNPDIINKQPVFKDPVQELRERQQKQQEEENNRVAQAQLYQRQIDQNKSNQSKKLTSLPKETQLSQFYQQVLNVSIDGSGNSLNILEIFSSCQDKNLDFCISKQSLEEIFYHILKSDIDLQNPEFNYFNSHLDKLKYVLQVIRRSQTVLNEENYAAVSPEDQAYIQREASQYLLNLILQPIGFNINNYIEEDIYNSSDFNSALISELYQSIQTYEYFPAINIVFRNCFENQPEDAESLLEALLKRILRDLRQSANYEQIHIYRNATTFLQEIFTVSKAAHFFLNKSQYFLSQKLINGYQLQQFTIFGQMLSVSVLPSESQTWDRKYLNSWEKKFIVKNISQNQAEQLIKSTRKDIDQIVIISLKDLILYLLKDKNINGIEQITKWMELVIKMNQDKTKLIQKFQNIDAMQQMGNDSFNMNFFKLALYLIVPFFDNNMDLLVQKVSSIDPKIVYENSGFFKEFEKILKAPENQMNIEQAYENKQQVYKPFPSKMFRIVLACIHINVHFFGKYENFLKEVNDLVKKFGQNSPEFQKILAYKLANDIYCTDNELWQMISKVFCFTALFNSYINGSPMNSQGYAGVINENPTFIYQQIPLFIIENMYTYLLFMRQFIPYTITDNFYFIQQAFCFIVVVMGNDSWCSNVHARSEFIKLLSLLTPEMDEHRKDTFLPLFLSNQSQKFLMSSLIRIFIDCEKTGGRNQYYDKYNLRHYWCILLTYLLQIRNSESRYINSMIQISKDNKYMFLEFTAKYISDIIHHIEEVLEDLKKLKTLEDLNPNMRDAVQNKEIQQLRNVIPSYSKMLISYYQNIGEISQQTGDIMLADEVRDNIVRYMNKTVFSLNNDDTIQTLNVKDFKELKFDVKLIMNQTVKMYLNFSKYTKFKEAVIRDQSYFNVPVFQKTADLLEKHNVIDQNSIHQFRALIQELHQSVSNPEKYNKMNLEDFVSYVELDDIPDKYQDQIDSEIMFDPVQLPKTLQLVDRRNVKRIMLNDQVNPFNKQPMREEDCIEMPALKKEIQQYLEQLQKRYIQEKKI